MKVKIELRDSDFKRFFEHVFIRTAVEQMITGVKIGLDSSAHKYDDDDDDETTEVFSGEAICSNRHQWPVEWIVDTETTNGVTTSRRIVTPGYCPNELCRGKWSEVTCTFKAL